MDAALQINGATSKEEEDIKKYFPFYYILLNPLLELFLFCLTIETYFFMCLANGSLGHTLS